ncbi:GNAT family N-acetyltransferase [Aquicoccus sp. G2-2]|uniref:GNAT family N-acetyltransferase n=1 Tax=Aquicoccus sp. G2-2 TaxID=3092120 RepID=UPI002ADF22FA|nr:GNAT family N-acetyltransferase [Aquicoccus sp. G2-2]MEA1113747.1 GNAT family N-acetyltransferase [Aquicoccus sp. G2-2]
MTARRARLRHLPAIARILWADLPRSSAREKLGDLRILARLIRRGQITQSPGRFGPRGFLIRDGVRIHGLYTHPRARRKGIGSRLMTEAQATQARLELWTAQSNAQARAFYAAHGFYPAALSNGQGNDEGQPDMRLIWERTAP